MTVAMMMRVAAALLPNGHAADPPGWGGGMLADLPSALWAILAALAGAAIGSCIGAALVTGRVLDAGLGFGGLFLFAASSYPAGGRHGCGAVGMIRARGLTRGTRQ